MLARLGKFVFGAVRFTVWTLCAAVLIITVVSLAHYVTS